MRRTVGPMKIRPLHDRILVKRVEEQEVRRGGIIIPDTAKEKPQEGKVIAVGNGKVTDDGKKILCLPFIRAIGSRRPPEVFVMEPTDAWHLHDNALARPLYTPRLRCVFSQG